MALYRVAHSCGHSESVQLYGPGKERERRMQYERTRPCPACRRAAEQAAATERAQAEGLPALAGTPKQVEWAQRIRHELLAQLDAYIASWRASDEAYIAQHPLEAAQLQAQHDAEVAAVQEVRDEVARHSRADWWIEHRTATPKELLRPVLERLPQ